ncbi:MAG: ATP-binding protein, partial [Hyphomonadaceae bacterium]
FATLTHELRTPLNGILGMTALVASSRLEPEARDHLTAIKQSGELLSDLINDILDYSRIEAGKVALDAAPFDPEAAAQAVAELLSPKAREKGLEIVTLARANAPGVVMGDEGRFRQILFNLAGNAVKFTEAGGVTIEIGRAKNGDLRVSVKDTGPGIAQEHHAAIFEEFTQADSSIARRYGGTGLGLAIVKRLAEAMKGRVGVESAPGRGATFWAELPLQEAGDAAASPKLMNLRIGVLTGSDVLAQALIATIASSGGAAARAAPDALESFDVVLIDHGAVQGDDLAAIAASARGVVALAPQEEREAIALHREAGIAHYVIKPIRRRSLAERILIAAGLARGARAAEADDDDRAQAPTLQGARVLLAEDNPINALLARTLLTRAGAEVDVVSTGRGAAEAAHAVAYDLIFLDLRMPELDGLAAARLIRGDGGQSARAPLVALTADAGEADRRAAHAAGMDAFVTKPIDAAQLASVAARFTRASKPGSFGPG